MSKTVALIVAALRALPLTLAQPAFGQTPNCSWYADISLKQQQQNEQRKCGFEGQEWSASRQAHLTWCASQPPDSWKAIARKREQMLTGCKR